VPHSVEFAFGFVREIDSRRKKLATVASDQARGKAENEQNRKGGRVKLASGLIGDLCIVLPTGSLVGFSIFLLKVIPPDIEA
jgi:hypothetical protein